MAAAAAAGAACLMAAVFPCSALGAQAGEQVLQQENSEYSIPGTWTGDDMDSRYLLEDGTFWRKAGCFGTDAGITWMRTDIRRPDGIKSKESGTILMRIPAGWPQAGSTATRTESGTI